MTRAQRKFTDDQLAPVFHALTDQIRWAQRALLMKGAARVSNLAEPFDMSLPAASQHLRVLESAGLIARTEVGRVRNCGLWAAPLKNVEQWLGQYQPFWCESLDALASLAAGDSQRRAKKPKQTYAWRNRRSNALWVLSPNYKGVEVATKFILVFMIFMLSQLANEVTGTSQQQETENRGDVSSLVLPKRRIGMEQESAEVMTPKVLAYASKVSAAQVAIAEGDLERARRLLAATKPSLRSWEYDYVLGGAQERGVQELKDKYLFPGHTKGAAFSADGKRLFVGNGTDVTVWNYEKNESKKLGEHGNGISCIASSPDGKKFASGAWDGKIIVWDANSGDLLLEYSGHNPDNTRPGAAETQAVRSLCFSPDSTRVVSTAFVNSPFVPDVKPELKIWSAETGRTLTTLEGRHSDGREFAVACVTYSSDGKMIATGGYDKMVRLWDAKSGKEIRSLKGHTNNVLGVAFSPDGTRVASASIDGTVAIWNVQDGQQVRRVDAGGFSVFSVKFSPDGKRFVSAGTEGSIKLWDLDTGVELHKLPKTKIPFRFVIFSPDGKHIAAGGDSPSRLSGTVIWKSAVPNLQRSNE